MPVVKSEVRKTIVGQMMCDFMSGMIAYLKKPDADNLLKQICDCLSRQRFWVDDNHVPIKCVVKTYDDGYGPRWDVRLYFKKRLSHTDIR
jgi:Holliday junction resolvase RusA-like endonuclease